MATSAGQVQSTIKVKATAQNLDKVEAQVSKLMLASEKIRTQQAKTATQMAKAVAIQNKDAAAKQKAALQTEKLSLQNQKLSNSISQAANKQSLFNKVLNTGKILAVGYTIKNLGNAFTSLVQGSADYIENLNLFNVVMGESKEKAENFINTMNDVLGLDTSKMMQYMGTFKGMANNMGIAEDAAYTMSEGLTKLTYDLSSFYNTSVDQAFTSLSSAITGQTKSIREQFKGIDVTMGTLQVDLDILGIDKTVSELSYAEKSILRYISILRQSQSAQGDFARTMTSPAQMMRQLTERVITLARAFGNIFIPILQAVLPYILAITSLLTKLFNTISAFVAKIFGFEMPEFDYSGITTGLGSASDDLDAVGDSASGASDKVKEFKKQLQGFDVLNVITSPTDTSDTGGAGGGGGGGAGMIDPALLEAIKNYDNRLDLASDKVKQLEAAIQSFLSKLNFEPLKKSLDNLWESMKLVGNFTWQGLKDFYNEFLVPVAQWTIGEGLPRFIDAIANGLAKIDWDNLNAKLKDLFQALAPFAIHVGEGLLWFFENVLVPLATWTISDVLPNFLSILTSAIKILNSAIEVASPVLSWLWDNFLSKIASFAGGAIVGILEGIAEALEWIADNETASKVLGGVLAALTGIATVKTAKSLLETAGGLSGLVSSAFNANKNTSALNKVLGTIGKTAKNSKGSVVILGSEIAGLASNSTKSITAGNLLTTMLKNMGSAAKSLIGVVANVGSSILTFGKNLLTGQVNAKSLGATLSGSLKNAFSSVGNSAKNMVSNLSSTISSYSQTASAATKLGNSLIGATGLVVGLKATSNGMKEIADNGEVTASSLGKVAGGLVSAAAGGAAIGASFGPIGAAIGGVAGALASAVSGLIGFNDKTKESEEIIKNLDESYDNYKQKIKDIKKSLDETIKSTNNSAAAKLAEIENSKVLTQQLTDLVDANGRVSDSNKSKADVIINQLNNALGTELSLEGNVIKNGDEIITNKEQLVDAINRSAEATQKETLLQAYQAQYTAAIESQIEAKQAYNDEIEKENEELQKALDKYNKGKISLGELEDVQKETTENRKNAEKKYQDVLDDTNDIIDGLGKVTETYASGTAEDMQNAIDEVTGTNKESLDETEKNFDKTTQEVDAMINDSKTNVKNMKDELKGNIFASYVLDTTGAWDSYNIFKQQISKNPLKLSFGGSTEKGGGGFRANGGIFDNGSWKPVPRYATGGLPDVGSMFVAGEAGPEWVGDINGKTGVLNSGQLSNVFANALDNVMSKYMNGNQTQNVTIPVYVGGDKVDEKQRQINLRNNNIYGTAR